MSLRDAVGGMRARAKLEERLMTSSFPAVYPGYKAKTKMLIPFVL